MHARAQHGEKKAVAKARHVPPSELLVVKVVYQRTELTIRRHRDTTVPMSTSVKKAAIEYSLNRETMSEKYIHPPMKTNRVSSALTVISCCGG